MDSAYNDNITGNSAGDTFYVGTGNDTFTGGGGADTFFFGGSQLGTDNINETSTNNTLNFYGFGAPINLDLTKAGTQTVSQSATSNLTLNLSNPAAFSTVVGSPYGGTIVGNNDANETIISGGGLASLTAGSGNDYIQGNITQVVYLDFPTAAQRRQATTFTRRRSRTRSCKGCKQTTPTSTTSSPRSGDGPAAAARSRAASTSPRCSTSGAAGGASTELDPGNLDLGGTGADQRQPVPGRCVARPGVRRPAPTSSA